jgi:hypothetical protein
MSGMTDRLKNALAKVKPAHRDPNHGWVEPSSSITRAIYEPLTRAENTPPVAEPAEPVAAEQQQPESDRKAGAA